MSQHNSNTRSWLAKIRALLAGTKSVGDNFPASGGLIPCEERSLQATQTTGLEDWIKAIDVLQPLVQSRRQDLEPKEDERFNLEVLGASTYLYHVDRLVVKIREHYLTYRYRRDQFAKQTEILNKGEFVQTYQICEQSYHTVLNITAMLQKLPNKRLYSDEFITLIHALELETAAIGSSIRTLNQFAYRQEAIMQIAELERTLMESLSQTHALTKANEQNSDLNYGHYSAFYGTSEYLRAKVKEMPYPVHEDFLIRIVDAYDMLKKCYVVARKSVIKDTLDNMGDSIEALILCFYSQEVDKENIYLQLHQIFNGLESLRFSTNRESRCSRNLFEKAKVARHLLRKACTSNAIGQEFLKQIGVKRTTLLRSKP